MTLRKKRYSLGEFAKLRKAPISAVVSVCLSLCLSVCPQGTV